MVAAVCSKIPITEKTNRKKKDHGMLDIRNLTSIRIEMNNGIRMADAEKSGIF